MRQRLERAQNCTHLVEMLNPLATAAIQSMSALRDGAEQLDASGRPLRIDSCYAYGAGRQIVRDQWPEHYRPEGVSFDVDAGPDDQAERKCE